MSEDKAVPTFTVGLQTSGGKMWRLVEKAMHQTRVKTGAEKIDLLQWLAEDVRESIETQKKMRLQLPELLEFLEREGKPSSDAASAIAALLALRLEQMERLIPKGNAEQKRKVQSMMDMDEDFLKTHVACKSAADLAACFELVPAERKEEFQQDSALVD